MRAALMAQEMEVMDMVAISSDNFQENVYYATVMNVLDFQDNAVTARNGVGCKVALEFVPMEHALLVSEMSATACANFTMIHFPILLLSVLPMLKNP